MKMTVLEMVQDILNDMDGDQVNSILDTVESEQVANILRTTYFEVVSNLRIPEHEQLIQLTGLGDTTRPNYMTLPSNVEKVQWIKYRNGADDNVYQDVCYLTPAQFLDIIVHNDGSNGGTQVEVSDASGATFYVRSDKQPEWWTSFDDQTIMFDSYNADVDTTLQASKTLAWGSIRPTFTLDDDHTPDLDANLFPLLLAEAKATCFVSLKQVANSKEEQKARRQRVRSVNDLHRHSSATETAPNYSRRRGR